MNHCLTCKHWDRLPGTHQGICCKIVGSERLSIKKLAKITAFVDCGSFFGFIAVPSFGCKLHEKTL